MLACVSLPRILPDITIEFECITSEELNCCRMLLSFTLRVLAVVFTLAITATVAVVLPTIKLEVAKLAALETVSITS